MKTNSNPYIKKFISIIKILIQIIIFITAIFFIHKEIQKYTLSELKHSFDNLSYMSILLIFFAVIIDYLILSSFDILAFKNENFKFSKIKTVFVSFISFAFSNSIGLSGLTASGIRVNLYSYWKIPYKLILKIVLFCYLTFWIGMLWMGGIFLTFFSIPLNHLKIKLPITNTHFIGIIFLISATIFSIYIFIHHKNNLKLFIFRIILALSDWIAISLVFYFALPTNNSLSFFYFFTIFITAQFIGIISNVPGGIGIFDLVALSLLSKFYSTNIILGSLLIYRLCYFFIPLLFALILFIIYLIKKQIR